jgi:aldehyde dehydrogenase (NAD+)
VLGDAVDANAAVDAARQALAAWSATSIDQRRDYLGKLAKSFAAHREDMISTLIEEFGTPTATAAYIVDQSRDWFLDAQQLINEHTFVQRADRATVHRIPVGVAVLITPWNGAGWFVAMKASVALAAGCTVVIKPSERGIWQAQPVLDAIADAGLPAGVINVVFGKGDPVGNILTTHPDVAKVSITGSTATGKTIAHNAVDSMKRVTLELGGKSPTIILDDADLTSAVDFAVQAGLFNNGQACIAGTRILIPRSREEEMQQALADDDEAVAIANDTPYGLHAYISTSDPARGERLARRLQAGRIMINQVVDSRDAPFGGFKQSGLGREFGTWGISAYLEDQAIFTS